MGNRIFLLMTATLEPHNCPARISLSNEERRTMYLRAFKYYLNAMRRRGCKYSGIVFCDNSGADLTEFKDQFLDDEMVELISAPPAIFPQYLGKNNDFNIIDYAVDHSRLLALDGASFLKVTGRYYITNINDLIGDVLRYSGEEDFFIDLCYYRHTEDKRRKYKTKGADTRYFYSSVVFWKSELYGWFKRYPENCPVESCAYDVAVAHAGNIRCHTRFRREAYIEGDEFTSKNAPYICCCHINMPPELYFKIRWLRSRVKTVLRRLLPFVWL